MFYYFSKAPHGTDFPSPAYFHKRDERDDRFNKGLNQLKVEVDFVVAADRPDGDDDAATVGAETRPEAPLLETGGPLPGGTTLYVRAVKAQTRIETPLDKTAQITILPEIRPENPSVAPNKQSKIRVRASHEGDRYELRPNGELVKRARNGDLIFKTGRLSQRTRPSRCGSPGLMTRAFP